MLSISLYSKGISLGPATCVSLNSKMMSHNSKVTALRPSRWYCLDRQGDTTYWLLRCLSFWETICGFFFFCGKVCPADSRHSNGNKLCPSFSRHFSLDLIWLVGCIEDLRRFSVFQPYRDLEAGDDQYLKLKWRGGESSPGPLAPQAKSLTTGPPPLPRSLMKQNLYSLCSQREGINSWHLSSASHTGTSIIFCQETAKSLRITWARCILLNLTSKTRQRATLLLFIWISVDREGRLTSHFHLWQTRRY